MQTNIFVKLLYSLSESSNAEDMLNAYLQYSFPESDVLYRIIYEEEPDLKPIPRNPADVPVPEEHKDKGLISVVNQLIIENGYDKSIVYEFNKKLLNPDYMLRSFMHNNNCRNLNLEAKMGELDPVIGREEEIDKLIQIVNNKKKRNPVLIGEAGVGKTAIVEGLAARINDKNVPISMLDKTIICIDVTEYIDNPQGASLFKSFLDIIAEYDNVLLFIDEVHMLSGKVVMNHTSLMDILKPPLARGKISVIAATTESEFRSIEKDEAMARRLQAVYVKETNIEETREIIEGIVNLYEEAHDVIFPRKYIDIIVNSSDTMAGYNPDKAITLLDNVMSSIKVNNQGIPTVAKEEDIINILRDKFRIRSEILEGQEAFKVYAQELVKRVQLIKKSNAEKLFKGIIKAHDNSTRNKVASITSIIGSNDASTRIAKEIAKILSPDGEYLYMNGSEFTDIISKSRILGAPPAYVGHGDKTFFNKVKHNAMPIVIDRFDAIEQSIKDIIKDIIKEGIMKTTSDEVIVFKNIDIIIATEETTIAGSHISTASQLNSILSSVSDVIFEVDSIHIDKFKKIMKDYGKNENEIKNYIEKGYTPKEVGNILKKNKTSQIFIGK